MSPTPRQRAVATAATNPFKRKTLRRELAAEDVEVHVSTLTIDGDLFYEIREYLQSSKAYGRGIVLPERIYFVLFPSESS